MGFCCTDPAWCPVVHISPPNLAFRTGRG